MTINKYRAQINSYIWKAIAQSGVSLNALSLEEQTKLVEVITDHTLIFVNDLLDDVSQSAKGQIVAPELDDEEQVIWEGRPFLSLAEFYTITNERIKIVKGLIGKEVENFELIRVQDIDVTQNMAERVFGIGDITISGADASSPIVILRNVRQPNEVYELLRKAWLAARRKYGLIFREDL